MKTPDAGFTLVELLVTLVVMSLVMAGVMGFFAVHARNALQQELTANLEANLRVAMETLSSSVRNADERVQPAMVTWVTLNGNPSVTQGSGSNPDTISVASCTAESITRLSDNADAALGANQVSLAAPASVNDTDSSLILIGGSQLVRVTSSDPGNPKNITPVLSRALPGSSPVCRMDVQTFDVDTTARTLRIDENRGAGAQPAVDGITNLQIAVNGSRYTITITGQSERKDPETGAYLTRSLSATVSAR